MSFQHKMEPSKKTLKKNLEANKDNEYYEDLLEYETVGNLDNYNKWFNYNETSFIIIDEDEHTIDLTGCNKTDFSSITGGSIYTFDRLLLDFDNNEEEPEKKRTYWYQGITKSLSKPLSKPLSKLI